MAATAKTQKEKPHALGPKLTPRHTAASMARAAKIATNRGLLAPKQSPTRFIAKARSNISAQQQSNSFYKNDSKTDCRDPIQKSEEFEKPLLVLEDTLETDEIEERSIEKPDIETFETHSNENIEASSLDVEDKNSNFMQTFTRSRPNTPQKGQPSAPSSRPTTPSSQRLSSSRPSTPASRSKIPSGRPSTPSDKTRVVSVRPPHKEEDDLKSTYLMKQREFQRMKKDLDLKQKTVLELYSSLKSMAEEGAVGCGEGFHISDLNIYDVGDWSSEEVAQLCRDAAAASDIDGAVELLNTSNLMDEGALADLDSKVSTVPARFADLCIQAYTDRQEVIDWVRELMPGISDEYVETVETRMEKYNTDGLQLCAALMDFKSGAAEVVSRITQISRQACRERSQLLAVGESLVREIERLRQDVDVRGNANEIHAEADVAKVLEESRRELEEEKAARAITKEKLATTESQLRQTRARVAKMDRQLREAEASIASLTGTVKTLEDQSRQREVQLEARARKLKESLKTGEVTSNQIAQQRDCLIAEVQSLKEQIEAMASQHKSTVQNLTKELKEHKLLLEEQRQFIIKENDARKSLDNKVAECEELIEQLRSKNTELENSRPNPELPTEREMDMWSELQATKDTLRITEEEVIACKREKVRFLETLTKISEQENKVGMQQKLAAELLSKEEIVSKMQSQIRELTKNMKLNEQKVIQYEQYVRGLQAHTHNMGAKGEESPNGVSYLDLQQEIMNLRMSLLEAEHRNEELSEFLAQKEQQLEQQDKTSRAQARIIKVREELINMLKNKETEQSRELSALQQDLEHRMKIVDEVNKQIAAKAEEIQELFATLENKQQQIHRLEKIVLALEEQQRRAQAQRTRHEEKIAALEHELAAGSRRERKFLFF